MRLVFDKSVTAITLENNYPRYTQLGVSKSGAFWGLDAADSWGFALEEMDTSAMVTPWNECSWLKSSKKGRLAPLKISGLTFEEPAASDLLVDLIACCVKRRLADR
jgi:hypothetical protein